MGVDLQSSVLNELFVLYPVIIQGWVTPVKPNDIADGGIPKALYDGQAQGLECLVDPWTELALRSWVMAVDDRVDLYLNDDPTPVTGKTVNQGEETLRQRLYVPHSRLFQGVNRLYYKVTRVGGNVEISRDLRVLYHLRPADSLDLVIPPDVLKDGVSAARAAQGVAFGFTYANRRNHDRIELLLGDTRVSFNVPDGTAPITHTVFTDTFQKAGDNPSAVAEFHVIDQLGNRVKSPEKRLNIHLDRLDLPAPTVKGQTGNNFTPTQQDVVTVVPRGSLLPTDKVTVKWQGAISTPAASFSSPQRLVSAGLEFVVPRSVLAYSLGKTVTVSYVIERNGIPSTSLLLLLNILKLPTTALIPPKIIEADANNVLDVIALGTSNATLHGLLWTLIEEGQQVWLTLEGKKADGSVHNLRIWNGGGHYANQTWVSQGFWPKPVANSYLKLLGHGSRLTIKFKASLDKSNVEATAVVFPDRTYTIRALALTAPVITSVKDLSGWEIPTGGYTVHNSVTLSGTANAHLEVEIFDDTTSKGKAKADAQGRWSCPLTGLAHARHTFKAKALYGSSTVSNQWSLTVVHGRVPAITAVTDSKGATIANGGSTSDTTVQLTGTGNAFLEVEIFEGSASKGKVKANDKGIWTLRLTGLAVGGHRFIAKALYGSGTQSEVWALTVRTFFSELTDFNNKSYGGWQKGPAGAELQFVANGNGYHLFNNTSQHVNHSGMVLQKMFTAEIGRQYKIEVTTRVVNYSSGNHAMLVLHVGGAQSPGFTINNGEWRTISFVAAATNTQLLLKITNIQTQRHGNDYDIDNILVRTVDN